MRGHRIGLVNPGTSFGHAVRERLAEQRLPAVELKLFEQDASPESTLTKFRDEVLVTQPLDVDLLPRLDVLFVSQEDSDVLNRVVTETASGGVLTLVHGAVGLEAPIVASASHVNRLDADERLGVVPRAASYVVGQVLGRLAEKAPVTSVAATILLPARDLGDRGAEELHQQTVSLLNFKPLPTEVFGEQMTFNVQRGPGTLADTVAREIQGLTGAKMPVQVQLARVPVFHGYAASVWISVGGSAEELALALDELRVPFRSAPFATAKKAGAVEPSPVGIQASSAIHVGAMRPGTGGGRDDPSGLWLWIVADASAFDPAAAAIEVAKAALAQA